MLSTGKSIFLIKITFVAISPEQQSFGPGRCPAHLLTDGIDAGVFGTLDNQFIMDMADDSTTSQRLHGITEDVPAGALDDVFHELQAMAFEPFPLLRCANAFIGDRFPTEAVLAYPGLYVGKPPSARTAPEDTAHFS